MAGMYDYEKQMSDLQNAHANQNATQDYANFISQQRFNRDRQTQDMGYQRAFPQFTGHYAAQLGSGIHSGVFGDKLQQNVGDYSRRADQLNQDQAQSQANYGMQQTTGDSQYQSALLALQEELQRQRAGADPYATYQAVNA